MPRPRFLVLSNAAAGGADRDALDAACRSLRQHGPVRRCETESPDELDHVVRDLDEGTTVVVAGGDGSLHAVVNRMREAGVLDGARVGLIPMGTGNDLARTLGIPRDPREAAAVVASGRPRRLDLLVDDGGTVVVNAAHAGLGAEAAGRAESVKGGLGPLAYLLGSVVAGVSESGWQLDVELDGAPLVPAASDVLLVAVGNGRTVGGGTPLCPSALPDDGLLDVVVSTATGPAARIAFAAALRGGSHVDRPDVVHATGRSVRVGGAAVRWNTDGEVADRTVSRRDYEVVGAAWQVLVPGG